VEIFNSTETLELLLMSLVAYGLLATFIFWLGVKLNAIVIRANDGQMPVVENHTGDRIYFDKIIAESDRHKWADKDTKLEFLADWINPPVWKNCPYWFAYRLYQSTHYNIIDRQKISIGDILLWTAIAMGRLLFLVLSCTMVVLFIYLVLFLI